MEKKRIRYFGKIFRLLLALMMIVSSFGTNTWSLLAHAGSVASGGGEFGQQAYGYLFGGSTHAQRMRTISYTTGSQAGNARGAKYMFCTESGKSVNSVLFANATEKPVTGEAAATAAYLMHEFVNMDRGGIGQRHLNHAAVSYYIHKNLETPGATGADFTNKANYWYGQGDAEMRAVVNHHHNIVVEAAKYRGPYTAQVEMVQIPGTDSATATLKVYSASGTDVSQWYGKDISLKMTAGGQFQPVGGGATTPDITIAKPADLANYRINWGPAGNDLKIEVNIGSLPGSTVYRYDWSNSQNMISSYVPDQTNLKASGTLVKQATDFSIVATTKTPTDLELGERLVDQITVAKKEGEWALANGQKIPLTLKVDWYFSTTDFGTTTYDVNQLPAGVTKLGTDTLVVSDYGTTRLDSQFMGDQQGYYYPVVRMDLNDQGANKDKLKEGFQAPFNDTNEKIRVHHRFAIKGTTKAKQIVNQGESLSDELRIDYLDPVMTWPNILGTSEKVPARLILDWYYSPTDYNSPTPTQFDVTNLPADVQYIGADELTIRDIGNYTVNSQFKSDKPGFYYPVLRMLKGEQGGYGDYFYQDFQAKFNETDEQSMTKWQPKVVTETTQAQLAPGGGKVADKLTVSDNKDGHEIVIESTLYGPYLTKPDFIQSPNQHTGGSTPLPPGSQVAGKVNTKITGNGTVTTDEITVTEPGWYVWVETIKSTTYTEEWHSNFGSANEYVSVPWVPNVETVVSDASATIGAQIYDTIKVSDLPALWGLLGNGVGDTDKWGQANFELKGKDRDPDKNGQYNLPNDWGKGEDHALEATFTMYYSPVKPIQSATIPAGAEIHDVVKAPLVEGELRTKEFKAFDKAGYYTIVVTGGADTGRLAKFQTDYGIPSETVHVPAGNDEEYYTQVGSDNVFIGVPVFDTLHVSKTPTSKNAEVTFTLYQYSDKVNDFDYSQPKELAKNSKGIPVTKFGAYKSNLKGYGLEDYRVTEVGTYGWVAEVKDTVTNKVIYKGAHGDNGEVFTVNEIGIHTKAAVGDLHLGEEIYDTVILETSVPDGYKVVVDLYKFSDQSNDFANAHQATDKDIVWTSDEIKVSRSGEYKTNHFKPTATGSYGFVETLYDELGNVVHVGQKGEPSENFTVYPTVEVATMAKDSETRINEGNALNADGQAKDQVTIIDTVSYQNLVPGREYTIKGILMDAKTGMVFYTSDRQSVTAEKTFTATAAKGTIDLTYTIKKTDMQGRAVVVFEELYQGARLLASHAELDDELQTVNYPDLKTNATDAGTGTEEGHATDKVTIIDRVTYKNLVIGREYTVKGVLMDKATGQPFITAEGQEVHAEKTFTADKENGYLELAFEVTKGDLAGKTIVVFEKLYREDKEVGSHTDLEDKDQTVTYPKIGTKAAETSVHGDEIIIQDIVSYQNLIPGNEYQVEGVLMDKATGQPVLVKGQEVTGKATFHATDSGKGTVKVAFRFPRSTLTEVKEMVVFERVYGATGKVVATHEDLDDEDQTVTLHPEAEIGTSAKDQATEMNEGNATDKVTIIDTVTYKNLIVGEEYTIKGILMDKGTNQPFETSEGQTVIAEKTFTATSKDGTIDLSFVIEKGDLAGKSVVVFEKLYHGTGVIADHEDITDKGQTVTFPEVATKAQDSETEENQGLADDEVTITDTVSYNNVIIGREYTVKGILMDKATGKPFLTRAGQEVRAEKTFTATKKNGTIDLTFVITKGDLVGKTVVVFETLYHQEKEVGSHTDINDEDQSIHFPQVGTKAAETSIHGETVTIEDTVSYQNLLPGHRYQLTGTLMDKTTGKPFQVKGKQVTATKEFVAGRYGSGTTTVTFSFPRAALSEETQLVVFEKLFNMDAVLVGRHEDINDKDQTVEIHPEVELGTSAEDQATGDNEGNATDKVTIIDTVSYNHLIIGKEYTVKGILMDQATNRPFLTSEGKQVTAEKTFTADRVKGTLELAFVIEKGDLAGKSVVVFEKLYHDGNVIGSHEEIDDQDQTVTFPEVSTDAMDKDTETNEGLAQEEVTIIDTVTYKNLVVGRQYTVKGILMDKATNKPFLTTDGKEVHAEKTFTAEKANGTVDLAFVITKGDLAGKTIVVFETLYHEEKEVGSHTDIEDEDQSVYYPEVGTKAAESSIHGETVTIEDTVTYNNLQPGQRYQLTGTLMDKTTGKAFLVDGKPVLGKADFTAARSGSGTAVVTFSFKRSALTEDTRLVVFEKLYGTTGELVGRHEDIEDEDQTVDVQPEVEISTSAEDGKTGENEGLAEEAVTIVDTVSYRNLIVGKEYTVKGVLMDKATNKPFLTTDGKEVHAEKTFVAEKAHGTIDLTFVITKGDLAGKTVVVFETLYHEGKEVGSHTDIHDQEQSVTYPEVGTKAAETSIHGDTVTIEDQVSYEGLQPGKEYTVAGVLMDKGTGEAFLVEGEPVTAQTTFTASKKGSGTVKVTFSFDRKALTDVTTLVVFEKLFNTKGNLVGRHEDLEDEDQTVVVKPEVEVKTNAMDELTEMQEGHANDEEVVIIDRVSYKHLIVGESYTVKGILMDKRTGEAFKVKRNGKWQTVTAEQTFVAKTSDGTIDLAFKLQKGDLNGETVVVFETLYHQDVEVGSHTDLEDEDQTVSYPDLGTKAAQTTGSTDEKVIIQDLVSYENLVPGQEYTVKGTLMDKGTGAAFLAEDKPVTSELTFTASESGSGTVTLTFEFLRSQLQEETVLVVFEKLFNVEDKLVGSHEDLEDEDQTVRQPKITTNAHDKETGTHEGFADDDVVVVDEVSYTGLKVGKEYTVKGVLMDKATGQPFLTRDGKEVHAEKTFTATQQDGKILLEFVVKQGDLKGKTVVVFEKLYQDDKEVAAHEDLTDEDQSVHYPKVGTQASESFESNNTDVVIKDIVYYENLLPGESYTVNGTLMVKASNQPLTLLGQPVTSQATFVASASGNGTVTLTFSFPRAVLAEETTLVVFEKLFDAKSNLIGAHEDINDPAQTVNITPPTTPERPGLPNTYGDRPGLPNTGSQSSQLLVIAGLMVLALAVLLVVIRKYRKI